MRAKKPTGKPKRSVPKKVEASFLFHCSPIPWSYAARLCV